MAARKEDIKINATADNAACIVAPDNLAALKEIKTSRYMRSTYYREYTYIKCIFCFHRVYKILFRTLAVPDVEILLPKNIFTDQEYDILDSPIHRIEEAAIATMRTPLLP
jgi:hypothetical protein